MHAAVWMNLENIMLSGRNQARPSFHPIFCPIPCIWKVQNRQLYRDGKISGGSGMRGMGVREWLLKGMEFLFGAVETFSGVVMVTQLWEYIKPIVSYTLSVWLEWYVNDISIKLLPEGKKGKKEKKVIVESQRGSCEGALEQRQGWSKETTLEGRLPQQSPVFASCDSVCFLKKKWICLQCSFPRCTRPGLICLLKKHWALVER